jgi:hypothetical protein
MKDNSFRKAAGDSTAMKLSLTCVIPPVEVNLDNVDKNDTDKGDEFLSSGDFFE